MRRLVMLTPVGPGLVERRVTPAERQFVEARVNDTRDGILPAHQEALAAFIARAADHLLQGDLGDVRRSCDELGAMLAYEHELGRVIDHHVLFGMDSEVGRGSVQAIAAYLRSIGRTVEVWSVPHLRLNDLIAFRCAASEVVRRCGMLRGSNKDVVFNVAGCDKAVKVLLASVACRVADETIELFGHTQRVYRIPHRTMREQLARLPDDEPGGPSVGEDGRSDPMVIEHDDGPVPSEWARALQVPLQGHRQPRH